MGSEKLQSFFFKIIVFNNLVFITLFTILSYWNRIAIDDFYFLANVNEYGIFRGTIMEYNSWSGRWCSVLIIQTVLSFYNFKYFLFIYEMGILILFAFSIKKLISQLNYQFLVRTLTKGEEFHLSVFIISAIFYSSVKIDETWFWLCASSIYLLSFIFLLLGTSAIISPKKNNLDLFLVVLPFLYIGGSSEPLALIVLFILICIRFTILFNLINTIKKHQIDKINLAFLSCLVSFFILYMAPGNRVREQFFIENGLFGAIFLNFKTTGMIILLRLPKILPYILLFTTPVYYWGHLKSNEENRYFNLQKRIFTILITYFAILYIYQLPVTYVTSDIAADRALFPITLFTLICSASIFYCLGLKKVLKSSIASIIVIVPLITFTFLNVYTMISQTKLVSNYSKVYDTRIEYLIKNKENPHPILLEPLPKSGFLYSAEISMDASYFANQHLKKGLGLKSDVLLHKQ